MRATRAFEPGAWSGRLSARMRRPSLRAAAIIGLVAAVAAALAWAGLTRGRESPPPPAPVAAVEQQAAPTLRELVPLLTRIGVGPGETGIDLMYAPPLFFEIAGQEPPTESRSRPTAIFVLQESIHEGEFFGDPQAFLLGPNGELIPPYDATLIIDGEHHRSTRLLFPLSTNAPEGSLTVVVPAADGSVIGPGTFVWELPLELAGATSAVAAEAQAEAPLPEFTLSTMAKALQRSEDGVSFRGVTGIEVSATYATLDYFDVALPPRLLAQFEPARAVVFLLSETTHDRSLPSEALALRLLSGGREYAPDLVEPRISSPHHRVTMVRFPLDPALANGSGAMELLLPGGGSMRWDLPVTYDVGAMSPFGLTWATILAMLAGLLAAMWPCLFQLTAFFIPTLAGVSSEQVNGRVTFGGHMKVMKAAMYFVLGFTVVYTAAGALIGLAAGRLADASDFERYQRYLAMVGGVIILVLAVRIAAKARAPLVCKMPVLSGMAQKPGGGSPREMMFAGLAFATGCMTCFGAAMVITMVIYVGLNGSMFFGAMVMFLFSLGMGIPLVIAAVAMARVLPLLFRLERLVPWMGLASSVLMVGFAILLLTGNYMLLTEWAYRLVGNPIGG